VIIDISKGYIQIRDDGEEISSVIQSQLFFWEFELEHSSNCYTRLVDVQVFLKVNKYLLDEGVKFILSDNAHAYLNKIEVQNLGFENLKSEAAKYKNGKYDKTKFEEFRQFINKNLKRTLKDHQLKASYHLYLLGNGANFSVPGSGKTTVVLAVYEKLRQEGKTNTLFVVGPPSSFGPWRHEFSETLGRATNFRIMAGGNQELRRKGYRKNASENTELFLTTFQTLLSDQDQVIEFLRKKDVNAFLIVDEAHYIKQLKGNWAKAALKQAEHAKFRCVLTGTPMPRSYTDIFNLFDFLWPNQHPITHNEKSQIKFNEERGNVSPVRTILDNKIGPLFYRVRKRDLKLKPQNFIRPHVIQMENFERLIYDAIFTRIKDYAKEDFYQNVDFINRIGRGRIIRLRQCISYPKLLNSAIDDYDEKLINDKTDLKSIIRKYDTLEVPGKITFLIKLVKKIRKEGKKVVIWSNFIDSLKLIEKHIKAAGFKCKKIYGGTPIEDGFGRDEETRERIRDEFIEPNSGLDILIANPAACAESISLHKTCHTAIYYDLTYNCAQYLQSLDRIHRVGGSEYIEANYHFLQYGNSIDADIKSNIDEKAAKMLGVIEKEYSIYSLNMLDADGDAEAYRRLFKIKNTKA
jgi:SNF2 family DNA or RNA helicase